MFGWKEGELWLCFGPAHRRSCHRCNVSLRCSHAHRQCPRQPLERRLAREQNAALSAQLAESQASLVAVQDDLAKLDLLEQIYDLDTDGAELGQTVANVIGSVDAALIIDKGTRTACSRANRSSTPMAT